MGPGLCFQCANHRLTEILVERSFNVSQPVQRESKLKLSVLWETLHFSFMFNVFYVLNMALWLIMTSYDPLFKIFISRNHSSSKEHVVKWRLQKQCALLIVSCHFSYTLLWLWNISVHTKTLFITSRLHEVGQLHRTCTHSMFIISPWTCFSYKEWFLWVSSLSHLKYGEMKYTIFIPSWMVQVC